TRSGKRGRATTTATAPNATAASKVRAHGAFDIAALAAVAIRQVVLDLAPADLLELRRVSRGTRVAFDQSVDSVGFAVGHLRRWIVRGMGARSWRDIDLMWASPPQPCEP
ncbi:hypothetical protein HK405_011078, partial [Cladochytrium tenue]